jgi:hypothetical protein
MIKKTVKVIHSLRLAFLLVISLFFLFVIGLNPVDTTKFIGAKLGQAVGMTSSVPENPFNKLAVQLKEKENSLNQREMDLDAKEQALNEGQGNNYLILVLGIGIIVLFFLVSLNYYLDYKRRKKGDD